MTFDKFKFKPFIKQALEYLEFTTPKPIQEEVIPYILERKSLVGQSETGSGKTHAFLLPIFQNIEPLGKVQVVITSPTRELAKQIYDMALDIAQFNEEQFKIRLYVGGTDREKELKWLENNQPDMVIGTPGRIWDLAIKEKKLLIYQTKYLIVDEADMTLETGFIIQLDNIAGMMPKDLTICVFSATIPKGLQPFLNKYLENPLFINLSKENITPINLMHYLIKSQGKDKFKLLLRLMKNINPYLAIIFSNTKKEVLEIVAYLTSNNYKVGQIHGDLSARERARMMREIRELRYTYIVATDIASRGIDIEGVSHIINFSLPQDEEFYIHRSGRAARNNLSGVVYSFYDFADDNYLKKLEKKGIYFQSIEILKDKIIKINNRNRRKEFIKKAVNRQNKVILPKPKKIKPNYKKKLREKGKKLAKRR